MSLSVIEALREIRHRPAMYIGSSSLKDLAMFLEGFTFAAHKAGVRDRILSDFQVWVEKRFNVHVSRGWWEIIRFHSGDGAEALNYFWELFDEYLEQSSGQKGDRGKKKKAV